MINPLKPTRTAALAALLLSFATAATAQSDQAIPWHHMAYEVDGVPGIALPQARIMLSEDVPAQRVKVAVLDCGVDADGRILFLLVNHRRLEPFNTWPFLNIMAFKA